MPIVSLENVSKRYPSPAGADEQITAVDGVTLQIDQGDVYGIIGYSGAGKSTLVRLINALEPASEGRITVDGVEITALAERELRRVRSGIGMIFQQFNLFSSKSVRANVAYPLKLAGWSKPDIEARVTELLTEPCCCGTAQRVDGAVFLDAGALGGSADDLGEDRLL